MKRKMAIATVMMAAVLGVQTARGESTPVVQGQIAGTELYPQFLAGSAGFSGLYRGRVGWIPNSLGTFFVDVTHDDLPPEGEYADILDGSWSILAGLQFLNGTVPEGWLYNNGDGTFTVFAVLKLAGNRGEVYFLGTLDHRPLTAFPPRMPIITGQITQQEPI